MSAAVAKDATGKSASYLIGLDDQPGAALLAGSPDGGYVIAPPSTLWFNEAAWRFIFSAGATFPGTVAPTHLPASAVSGLHTTFGSIRIPVPRSNLS